MLTAQAITALWVVGVVAEIAVALRLSRIPGWQIGSAGLSLNAAKSIGLMVLWRWWGDAAYSTGWRATRWIHWLALCLLLIQALVALARVWPRGRRLAVVCGVLVSILGVAVAALQSHWIVWRGAVGAATDAGRAVGVAGILIAGGSYVLYDALGVTTRNARAWSTGLLCWLGGETVAAATMAYWPMGWPHIVAQLANQSALIVAARYWWRMSALGEDYVLPVTDAEREWKLLSDWIGEEKTRRRAAGL